MNNDEIRENVETRAAKLEEAFLKNLQKGGNKITVKGHKQDLNDIPEIKRDFDTEKLLLRLYEVRDGILDSFSQVNYSSKLAQTLSKHINVLGSCINDLGGKADSFDPLSTMSGLSTPNLIKNAERIIETTKQCYTLGKIEFPKIEEDGKIIKITFAGKSDGMVYKAKGTIKPKNSTWIGSEAIDYIYLKGSGNMSVKSLNANGRWVDISNDYEVYWNLSEIPEDEAGIIDINNEINKQAGKTEDDVPLADFPIKEVDETKDK